jgi:ligand-binding sensor domain-containing protein
VANLDNKVISTLIIDNSNTQWVGTENGLTVYNGSSWSAVSQSLPDNYVTAIAFDKDDGSAWIGTKKGLVNVK